MLVEHFVKNLVNGGRSKGRFSEKALIQISQYNYPGNVRELKNIVERTLAICEKDIICVKELALELKSEDKQQFSYEPGEQEETLHDAKKHAERNTIIKALKQAKGNKVKAAKLLQISMPTLYAKLKSTR